MFSFLSVFASGRSFGGPMHERKGLLYLSLSALWISYEQQRSHSVVPCTIGKDDLSLSVLWISDQKMANKNKERSTPVPGKQRRTMCLNFPGTMIEAHSSIYMPQKYIALKWPLQYVFTVNSLSIHCQFISTYLVYVAR